MGTQSCDWSAGQNSRFSHLIGWQKVLSQWLSPRVSRLSVCGTGLHCWTKGKCSRGEEVQCYNFKPTKHLQNRKYIFARVSGDYTNIFFFAPWSLASFNFFASEKLILTESLLVIERTRDVRHRSRTPGTISFPQILKR